MENITVIPIEKLPFEQFKLLGMGKKDVLNLPESTKESLLSGNRTSLIQFNNLKINEFSEPVTLNAKLSLQKIGEEYKLIMHPVNLKQNNNLDLSENETAFLQKDPLNILPKKVVDKNGKLIDSFISFDRVTNEFIAVKKDKIKSPESINNIYLSNDQKKDFVNGKPIQIGKENFQLDMNSEQGISGKNLNSVKFKSGTYNTYNLVADFALLLSGLGALVLVEHLAKMIFNNREAVHALLSADLKPAIKRTLANISENSNNGKILTNKEKNELLVVNVKDTLQEQKKEVSIISEQVSVIPDPGNKPEVQKFTYSGTLLEHGTAQYEFDKANKNNYFLKLETESGKKIIWGQDFIRAVDDSNGNFNVGDKIGVNFEGNKRVTINEEIKDTNGKVIGSEEKTVNRNEWTIKNLSFPNLNISSFSKNEIPNSVSSLSHEEELLKMPVVEPKNINKETADASKIITEIINEKQFQSQATAMATKDNVKINHPDEIKTGELKTLLKADINKQNTNIANSINTVNSDKNEIAEVKKGIKR